MRVPLPVFVLAVSAIGCVQGKVLTDPASNANPQDSSGVSASVLAVTPSAVAGNVGQTIDLSASLLDKNGHPIAGQKITWTSTNTNVATIDTAGHATLLAQGTTSLTASAHGLHTNVPATVNATGPVPVAAVNIAPSSVSLNPGGTGQLTATLTDSSGDVLNGRSTSWSSSNTSVATVSTKGVVTAIAVGTAIVTASAEGKSATATVNVVSASPASVASITVTPASTSVVAGNTAQLTATVKDSAGNVLTGRSVSWTSSNQSFATITSSGVVTGVAAGSATITASSGGKSGTAGVNVSAAPPPPIARIIVSPASASLTTGGTQQFTVTVQDANGNTLTGRTVSWTSDNHAVATVSSSGFVTSVGAGSVWITAYNGTVSGSASVSVTDPAVATVALSPTSLSLTTGGTGQLTATPKDAGGNVLTGRTQSWSSSNSGVATVSSSGGVTAVTAGSATITVTIGGKSATASVAVSLPAVATVTVAPTSLSLTAGGTGQLTATPKDAGGNVLTGRTQSWSSSNTGVATVSSSGVVTAVAAGSATITITIGGVSATASVTVSLVAVSTVTVAPTSLSLTTGGTGQLTATPKDAGGNVLTGRTQSWSSSNTGVATVSSSGVVTAVTAGSATITVTIGGKSATASVTANAPTVASVSVSPTSASLTVGQGQQLTAVAKDASGATISGATFSWSSSNTGVASVTSSGYVNAAAAGSATITASSGGHGGTASISVTASSGGPGTGPGYPHEPAGFTTFTDRAFNTTNEDGWTTPGGNASIVQDASAPASPSNVMMITYNAGLSGGDTPMAQEHSFGGATEFYGAIWIKFSSNFVGNGSGVNKILYVWTNDGQYGTPAIYLSAQGSGSGNFQPQVRTQDATFTDLGPNMSGQSGYQFPRNTWVKWEFYLKMNTPGQSNGIVRCWMNGVQVSEYTNQLFSNAGSPASWNKMQIAPYWGGIGGTVSAPQYLWMDHLHGSAK